MLQRATAPLEWRDKHGLTLLHVLARGAAESTEALGSSTEVPLQWRAGSCILLHCIHMLLHCIHVRLQCVYMLSLKLCTLPKHSCCTAEARVAR